MSTDTIRTTVLSFYQRALTVGPGPGPSAVLDELLAEDFQSVNGQGSKSKAALMQQVEHFWKLVPDLRWEPQDIVVEGDKVVVRSVAPAPPAAPSWACRSTAAAPSAWTPSTSRSAGWPRGAGLPPRGLGHGHRPIEGLTP